MPAVPVHHTAVVDTPWDAGAAEKALKTPLTLARGNAEYAWRDPNGDETTKAAWKFPHHQVDAAGEPGAANLPGVRNAMARLTNAGIPEGDKGAVRSHLQAHLDDAPKKKEGAVDENHDYAAALARLTSQPLSITATAAIAEEYLPVVRLIAQELALEPSIAAQSRTSNATRRMAAGGEIAVLPLQGVITPRGSMLARIFGFGGGGLVGFREDFRAALADDNVSAIIIDIDSPGGLIDQVPETAAEILAARNPDKPIVAVANTLAASAAYWIASAADEISVTPSGQVGSVGVFTVHEDVSKMAAQMGITVTVISAGRYKTEGNPYEPLSKAAAAAMQVNVDDIYGMFVDSIAAGRGVAPAAVRAGYGEGRVVLADRAQQLKMVDRVETLEAAALRLGGMPVEPDEMPDEMPGDEMPDEMDDGASKGRAERTPEQLELAVTIRESEPVAADGELTDRLYGEDRREAPAWLLQ
jgi:signal peptide peptidase SppA